MAGGGGGADWLAGWGHRPIVITWTVETHPHELVLGHCDQHRPSLCHNNVLLHYDIVTHITVVIIDNNYILIFTRGFILTALQAISCSDQRKLNPEQVTRKWQLVENNDDMINNRPFVTCWKFADTCAMSNSAIEGNVPTEQHYIGGDLPSKQSIFGYILTVIRGSLLRGWWLFILMVGVILANVILSPWSDQLMITSRANITNIF